MAYFSPKSTWLSLVDGQENPPLRPRDLEEKALAFEDYRPCFPGMGDLDEAGPAALGADDLESLRITQGLRHRLFFHFREWEFGPALLEDHIKLAQAQSNPEEALAHYCHARHVAQTLVEKCGQGGFLLAWLETDRVIAEIHHLIGQNESCAVYAKEGLETIKKNRFDSSMDLRITKLAIRFFKLLGKH